MIIVDQNPSWSNAIIEICDDGQIEVIKKMFVALNQSKYLIYEKSPLQQAALVGDIETIEFLVPLLRENEELKEQINKHKLDAEIFRAKFVLSKEFIQK